MTDNANNDLVQATAGHASCDNAGRGAQTGPAYDPGAALRERCLQLAIHSVCGSGADPVVTAERFFQFVLKGQPTVG